MGPGLALPHVGTRAPVRVPRISPPKTSPRPAATSLIVEGVAEVLVEQYAELAGQVFNPQKSWYSTSATDRCSRCRRCRDSFASSPLEFTLLWSGVGLFPQRRPHLDLRVSKVSQVVGTSLVRPALPTDLSEFALAAHPAAYGVEAADTYGAHDARRRLREIALVSLAADQVFDLHVRRFRLGRDDQL